MRGPPNFFCLFQLMDKKGGIKRKETFNTACQKKQKKKEEEKERRHSIQLAKRSRREKTQNINKILIQK